MFLIPEYFLGDPVGSEAKATDFLNDAENPVSPGLSDVLYSRSYLPFFRVDASTAR